MDRGAWGVANAVAYRASAAYNFMDPTHRRTAECVDDGVTIGRWTGSTLWWRFMVNQVTQTADAQGRIMLPAAFAGTTVVVEMLSPSEVRVRKIGDARDQVGVEDLMRLAQTSGAFDFWNDPAEDIYSAADGEAP